MEAAVAGLQAGGHGVDMLDLYGTRFAAAMSCEKRRSHEDDQRELDPQLMRHGELVLQADALIFVFPT
jgi:putative NADPH-quinone reductase